MNIDDKIKKFEQSCEKLAQMDAEKLNEKINNEIEEQIETELEEYIKKQEIAYKKQCEKVVKEYNKSLFEYEVECKKSIQNVKDIINRELKDEIVKRLQVFTDRQEYVQYLLKNINDALKVVDNDSTSVIYVTKKDSEKYFEVLNKYNFQIGQLDDCFIGGCKVKSDKLGVVVDNTLKSNLDEKMSGGIEV